MIGGSVFYMLFVWTWLPVEKIMFCTVALIKYFAMKIKFRRRHKNILYAKPVYNHRLVASLKTRTFLTCPRVVVHIRSPPENMSSLTLQETYSTAFFQRKNKFYQVADLVASLHLESCLNFSCYCYYKAILHWGLF